jgi:hypothetical protein
MPSFEKASTPIIVMWFRMRTRNVAALNGHWAEVHRKHDENDQLFGFDAYLTISPFGTLFTNEPFAFVNT